MSFPWVSWLPRIMYSINTQVHTTTKEMPYKLVFGQNPRSQLIPGAEQHIVMEEEITEVTQSAAVAVASEKEQSSPPAEIPPQEPSDPQPQNWIIEQQKELRWTPSPPFSLPSLSSSSVPSPTSSTSSSSSGLPSIPSSTPSPEVKLNDPCRLIPSPTGSFSNSDLLQEELSSAGNKRKEPESPDGRHENIRKKARNKTFESAIKMSNYYNKTKCAKGKDFKEGQLVSFSVPKIDRCTTDMQRIPGEIVNVTGGDKIKYYQVATSAGIIKHAFRLGDLAAYTGEVKINKSKVVSVRQAALEINAANRFTVNRCKCKGKCNTAQCSCIRSHISCSNHCHPGSTCENTNIAHKQTCKQQKILSDKDIETLENGWLTDEHMLKANNVLKKDYPSVDGLQDTLLQQNFSWDIPSSEFVQVLHVNGNHWITISNIGVSDQSVNVYDSLYNGINQATKELIAKYVHKDKVKINIINVQQQENESDCGVFAIAFAKCLLEGKDPSQYDFVNPRKHLAQYLPQGIIPEFPKVLAEHLPNVLKRVLHIQLKPVPKNIKKHEVDFLCLM